MEQLNQILKQCKAACRVQQQMQIYIKCLKKQYFGEEK